MGVIEKIINNIPVTFVSKMHILNLYVRKKSDKPKLRDILQHNSAALLEKCQNHER